MHRAAALLVALSCCRGNSTPDSIPLGGECLQSSDCQNNAACIDSRCLVSCSNDAQCGADSMCIGGACTLGSGDGATGATGVTGTTASTGALPSCPYRCIPSVPPGFSGPGAMTAGSSPPSCGGLYAGAEVDGYQGYSAGSQTCSCSCSVTEFQCKPEYAIYPSGTACSGTPAVTGLLACGVISEPTGHSIRFAYPTPTVMCGATLTATIGPTGFSTTERFCASSGANQSASYSCTAGDTCVQGPDAGWQLCIFGDGSIPCPSDWPNATTGLTQAGDDRSCSACTCNQTSADCIGGDVLETYSNQSVCQGKTIGVPTGTGPFNSCDHNTSGSTIDSFVKVRAVSPAPSATCGIATDTTATGSVAPTGLILFCCQ